MNSAIVSAAAELVKSKIGLAIQGRLKGGSVEFWPSDLHQNETFRLVLHPGWRSADVNFELGPFAGEITRSIARASTDAKMTAEAFLVAMRNAGLLVKFDLNGKNVDFRGDWPQEITSMDITVRQRAIVFDSDSESDILGLVDRLVVPLFGVLTSLIGVEDIAAETGGIEEGAPYQSLLTRYERKRVNREACLRLRGAVCAACGFDFFVFYGDIGRNFIEIHHIESLADIGKSHPIDPAKDLVPLCSNCHAMVHRHRPAYTVEALRKLIAAAEQ
jgi:5-methylcytosine-specific restriction protein A